MNLAESVLQGLHKSDAKQTGELAGILCPHAFNIVCIPPHGLHVCVHYILHKQLSEWDFSTTCEHRGEIAHTREFTLSWNKKSILNIFKAKTLYCLFSCSSFTWLSSSPVVQGLMNAEFIQRFVTRSCNLKHEVCRLLRPSTTWKQEQDCCSEKLDTTGTVSGHLNYKSIQTPALEKQEEIDKNWGHFT